MLDMLFSFRGRIGRLAWWSMQMLIVAIMFFVVFATLYVTDTTLAEAKMVDPMPVAVAALTTLLTTWMSLAATFKRYHDRDKSGWWFLISFVPVIGQLIYVIELGFLPGTAGRNSYGDSSEAMSKAALIQSVRDGDGVRPEVRNRPKQREEGRHAVKINPPTGVGFGRRSDSPYAS